MHSLQAYTCFTREKPTRFPAPPPKARGRRTHASCLSFSPPGHLCLPRASPLSSQPGGALHAPTLPTTLGGPAVSPPTSPAVRRVLPLCSIEKKITTVNGVTGGFTGPAPHGGQSSFWTYEGRPGVFSSVLGPGDSWEPVPGAGGREALPSSFIPWVTMLVSTEGNGQHGTHYGTTGPRNLSSSPSSPPRGLPSSPE